jgi:hypothetical protein
MAVIWIRRYVNELAVRRGPYRVMGDIQVQREARQLLGEPVVKSPSVLDASGRLAHLPCDIAETIGGLRLWLGLTPPPLTPEFHRLDERPVADADVRAVFRCERTAPTARLALDAERASVDRDPFEGEIGAVGGVSIAAKVRQSCEVFRPPSF